MRSSWVLAVGSCLFPVLALCATVAEPPQLRCSRVTAAPVIDGRLADVCWQTATELAPFGNASGQGLPQAQSRAYLLHDDANLYLAVECDEPLLDERLQRTHELRRAVKAHDGDVWADECVEVFIDPRPGQAAYYHWAVNLLGTVYDAACNGGVFRKEWESGATAAATTEQNVWRVEMAIPRAACGLAAASGTRFGFNVCRSRWAVRELSAWAPTGAGFHTPERFGLVTLADSAPGLRRALLPGFAEGARTLAAVVVDRPAVAPLELFVKVRYGDGDWLTSTAAVPAASAAATPAAVTFQLQPNANECFSLNAPASADRTRAFRTDYVPVVAGARYAFSARVRAEGLAGGGARPPAFSISSYDAERKAIRTYETVAPLPLGTYDWRPIEGMWTAAPNAAEVLLWFVAWEKTGVTGKAWLDDIRLCREGTAENVVPNGAMERDAAGRLSGWPVAFPVASSYARSGEVAVRFGLRDAATGEAVYESPVFAGTVERRDAAIGSSLTLCSAMSESADMLRLGALYAAPGGYLYLPLVLRSAVRETLTGCSVTLDVPDFLQLFDPAPRARIVDVQRQSRHGEPRCRYTVAYAKAQISPVEAKKETTVINHLLLRCGVPPADRRDWTVRFNAAAADKTEPDNDVPLTVLPPLGWVRPERVPIVNWACSTFYRPYRQLSEPEQELVVQTWRLAGFTQAGESLGSERLQRYGFRRQRGIPLINAPGSLFPGGTEYLTAHNEARAVSANGKRQDRCFCPTYFLSAENGHWPEAEKWLRAQTLTVDQMDWDYEVPVTRPESICFCERCLAAFRERAGLPAAPPLTSALVLEKHRKAWVDFRCWQNSEIAVRFRQAVKAAKPDITFSIYSGYQGPTDEAYGVDWRTMGTPADLVWCGYGRPVDMIAATHQAIGDRPLIGGELAWYGTSPYDNTQVRTALFRRLTDCGSGIMTYFNWIVDGRLYAAVAAVASVTADFEPFFQWDADAQGIRHSRFHRDDRLVRVAGDAKDSDVTVLTHSGERLVFLFNESDKARRFDLEHADWEPGLVCVDYQTRQVQGARLTVEVPARDVRVLHVRRPAATDTVGAPDLISADDIQALGCLPLLVWRGRGTHPGDQTYTLELSARAEFAGDGVVRLAGLDAARAVLREPLRPGAMYFWRVQARDVATGKTGPFSAPGSFRAPTFVDFRAGPGEFSPNGDNVLDAFRLEAFLAAPSAWRVSVIGAASGETVWAFAGEGDALRVDWDGKSGAGAVVPEGEYRYEVVLGTATEPARRGRVDVNLKAGTANPAFAPFQGCLLTVKEGAVTAEPDYVVTGGGPWSLRLHAAPPRATAYWSNYAGGGAAPTPAIPVRPGKTYVFAARLKTDLTAGTAAVTLAFFTHDGHWAAVPGRAPWGVDSETVSGRGDWCRREVKLTAPADARFAVVFAQLKDAAGDCWLDAPELKQE